MDRQHLPLQRTAELLAELLDAPVSTGWLCAVQVEAAGRLAGFITTVKDALGNEPVVRADETGTHVGLVKHWVHTLSTNLLTLLVVHPKRGVEALEDIGVLGDYTGTIVHDGWGPYDTLTGATHAISSSPPDPGCRRPAGRPERPRATTPATRTATEPTGQQATTTPTATVAIVAAITPSSTSTADRRRGPDWLRHLFG